MRIVKIQPDMRREGANQESVVIDQSSQMLTDAPDGRNHDRLNGV